MFGALKRGFRSLAIVLY